MTFRLPRSARPLASSLLVALVLIGVASAKPLVDAGVESNENDFLAPDAAFRVSAQADGQALRIRWVIADGYYLYRQKMQVAAESPDLVVAAPSFPRGTVKIDPYLGTQEIFTQQVEGTAEYRRTDAGAHPLQVKVTYQGCAEAGLCYPPITKVIFPAQAPVALAPATVAPATQAAELARTAAHPWEGYAIGGGILAFFLAGLLLQKNRRLALPA